MGRYLDFLGQSWSASRCFAALALSLTTLLVAHEARAQAQGHELGDAPDDGQAQGEVYDLDDWDETSAPADSVELGDDAERPRTQPEKSESPADLDVDESVESAEPVNPWSRDPFLLELHLGFAVPVGFVGATLEYSPIENMSLVCGAGTNLIGLQLECMARARSFFKITRKGGLAGYLGAGASMGPHRQTGNTNSGLLSALLAPMASAGHDSGTTEVAYLWERAYWMNLELGLEARVRRVSLRAYLGLAWMLNFEDGERHADSGLSDQSQDLDGANAMMPYGGLAIGYPF